MEMKWYMIGLMGIALAGMIPLSINQYTENKTKIEYAKMGLEECPNLDSIIHNATTTIWVKSCKNYTDNYYLHNKEDK